MMSDLKPEKQSYRPPPLAPDIRECCAANCDPCIFDFYEKALARWQANHPEAVAE
jgi:hypothetical protein